MLKRIDLGMEEKEEDSDGREDGGKERGKDGGRMKENKNHFCKMTKCIEYDIDKLLNMFHISHLCV